jgi:hypothetical protein
MEMDCVFAFRHFRQGVIDGRAGSDHRGAQALDCRFEASYALRLRWRKEMDVHGFDATVSR